MHIHSCLTPSDQTDQRLSSSQSLMSPVGNQEPPNHCLTCLYRIISSLADKKSVANTRTVSCKHRCDLPRIHQNDRARYRGWVQHRELLLFDAESVGELFDILRDNTMREHSYGHRSAVDGSMKNIESKYFSTFVSWCCV
jgi:hypothetical protein